MELKGKNIVFVGGTGGIGRDTCKELMRRNVKNLVILDKCDKNLALKLFDSICPKVQLHFWYFDVTANVEKMKEIFQEIVEKIGKIDVLINGAGILNEQEILKTVQINLIGCINTIVAVFDYMDKRNGGKGGVIINIASVAGLNGSPAAPVYSATKAGLVSFSTSIAELKSFTGIKVITICPGFTRTPILHNVKTFLGFHDTFWTDVAKIDMQTTEECSKNLVDVIEDCKNGTIWILDNNEKKTLEFPVLWQLPKELL